MKDENSGIARMFAANVPRYTSYPTAPHFHGGIGDSTYRGWLADLDPATPLSLYAHIPFCDSLCWFCACHTTAVNNYTPVRNYCDDLLREIDRVADSLPARMKVRHIHWGGGSPTMLDAGDVARLNDRTRQRFDVALDAEFAVEIDPRGFTPAMAAGLGRAGVTRASLGAQDCDPKVQRAINRLQSDDETFDAIANLRAEGVHSINIDLVYGLPLQTLDSWSRTLEFILWLRPDRIAVFGYAHVPSFKKHQTLIPPESLPDLETRFHMAELARIIFVARGYVAVGIDHYALPRDGLARAAIEGRLHRNFQGYTTDKAPVLLGFGASAISVLPQGYVQNKVAVPEYRKRLAAGELAVARGIALTPNDCFRRAVIERLMCDLTVDLSALQLQYAAALGLEEVFAELAHLEADGIIALEGSHITIRPKWRSAARLVVSCFDQYLERAAARYSSAV
ncbi:MAG TPA: oxygen-independent coproporphyrinogen III oxidase [Rhizomicrobium sp.]|nr:oxygen-independent coproporphyrinogen III oxidase [Rhizomicrobium sp.]